MTLSKIEILKRAEQIEKEYLMVAEPTKGKEGIAIRLCNDPEIQIAKIRRCEWSYDPDFVIKGKVRTKKYEKCLDSIYIDTKYVPKLIEKMYELLK